MSATSSGSEILNQVLSVIQGSDTPLTAQQVHRAILARYGRERSMKEVNNRLVYGVTSKRLVRNHPKHGPAVFSLAKGVQMTPPTAPRIDLGERLKPTPTIAPVEHPAPPIRAAAHRQADAITRVQVVAPAEAAASIEPRFTAETDADEDAQVDSARALVQAAVASMNAEGAPPAELTRTADPVTAPFGLRDRLRAISGDLEDALGDACDAQLAHRLIKSLVVGNAAVRRAIEEITA